MQTDHARADIINLISQNFGDPTAKTFSDFNSDEPFPIFIASAYELLKELLGERKAREQIDMVLAKHSISEITYE